MIYRALIWYFLRKSILLYCFVKKDNGLWKIGDPQAPKILGPEPYISC